MAVPNKPSASSPRQFAIQFGQEEVIDLRARLSRARIPTSSILPLDDPRSDHGLHPTPQFLHKYIEKWSKLDFETIQTELNKYPQYLVDIDWCKPLHFIHRSSSRKDAIPLLLIHGWPGTFHEFIYTIDQLAEPNDVNAPAFHVVVPSLPGFCYSQGPPSRKAGIGDVDGYCRILDALMVDVLSYSTYAAQGGDWGSPHARILASRFARSDGTGCRAAHLNFLPLVPRGASLVPLLPEWMISATTRLFSQETRAGLSKLRSFSDNMAYYWMQQKRPSQLSPALLDSPLGLLSWLGFFYGPSLNRTPTLDEKAMLTVCSLFWFTKSIGTSFLPYHNNESLLSIHGGAEYNVKTALAYSNFPLEIANTTQSAAKSTGNLLFYAKATKGGHFAALEEPSIFVNHLRLAFSPNGRLWTSEEQLKDKGICGQVITGGLWDQERAKSHSKL